MTDRGNQIDRFLGDALASAELRSELLEVIWDRDNIVALGKKHGYDFTRHDLDGFIRNGSLLTRYCFGNTWKGCLYELCLRTATIDARPGQPGETGSPVRIGGYRNTGLNHRGVSAKRTPGGGRLGARAGRAPRGTTGHARADPVAERRTAPE